jgi:hypothetical protein
MYEAEISRRNPTCFLFLIDQSGSMGDTFGGDPISKAEALADVINRLFDALVDRCAKGVEILDRYFIGVLGYGGDVRWAFEGALKGRDLVPVSEIGRNPLRIETRVKREYDGAGGLIEKQTRFPIWFEAKANGGPRWEKHSR